VSERVCVCVCVNAITTCILFLHTMRKPLSLCFYYSTMDSCICPCLGWSGIVESHTALVGWHWQGFDSRQSVATLRRLAVATGRTQSVATGGPLTLC
jgi:hypothetical protein